MRFFQWFTNIVHAQTTDPKFGLEYAQNLGLGTQDIRSTIFKIINIVLGFTGIIFLGLIMYGGYLYMMSQDNAEKQNTAKATIRNAIIGLVIVLSAFGITQFILYQLGGATGLLEPCENIGEVTSCWIGGCEGDRQCTSSGYWSACDIGSCDPSAIPVFYVRGTYPHDGDTNTIRNLVLQAWFNQKIEPGSLQMGTPEERIWLAQSDTPDVRVAGTLSIVSNDTVVEFRGSDACLDENGAQLYNDNGSPAMGCLASNTEYILTLEDGGDGIQSLAGDDLNCGVNPCVVRFTTGEFIDLKTPKIEISDPGKMCVYDSSYPPADGSGAETPIQAIVTDDYGVSYINFSATNTDTGFAAGDASFPLSDLSCVGTPGGNAGVVCTAIYYWDRSGFDPLATANIRFDVSTQDLDDHQASASISKPLRPAYCCDGVLSGDETAVDSGGLCGFGDGESCSTDQQICDPNPAGCSSTFCDETSCLCFSPPFIDAISPLLDDTPIAAEGNFITLWGRNFGSEEGEVWFLGADTDTDGEKKGDTDDVKGISPKETNANCSDTWKNTEIIILVPTGAKNGPIEVRVPSQTAGVDPSQFVDRTDDVVRGALINDLLVDPQYSAPGICRLSQTQGEFNQAFDISGINLNGSGVGPKNQTDHHVIFGTDAVAALGDGAAWTDKEIQKVLVPNVAEGRHTVQVMDNNVKSNGLLFQVSPSGTLPYIADISPDQGGAKQYLTLSGDRFGSLPGQVKFFSYTSGEIFYGTSDFPEICQSDWWLDNQIIIKVPTAVTGAYGVSVVNSLGESNIVRFDIINDSPGPGLCLMIPQNGIEGAFVDLYGEFFVPAESGDAIIFHSELPSAGRGTWQYETNENVDHVVQAKVPTGVLSGPVFIKKSAKNSNPLNFTVGACDPSDENACDSGNSACCSSGRYENMCVPKDAIDCDAGFASCSYQWSFSTWRDTVCVGEECNNPPQVENDPSCTNGTFASPTPYSRDSMDAARPYEENVCVNAAVSVRFSQKVLGLDSTKITLRQCGSTSSDLSSCDTVGVKLSGDIVVGATSEKKSFFVFYPINFFLPNTWYKISILDTVTNEDGVPLDGDGDKFPGDPYWMSFKTSAGEDGNGYTCEPSEVIVNPEFTLLNYRGEEETFTAGAVNEQCFIVSGMDYDWNIDDKNIATIESNPDETQAIVAAGAEGDTLIRASVNLSRGGSLSGTAEISVRYADLFVEDYWPSCESACVNAGMGADFSLDLLSLEKGNLRTSFSGSSEGSSSDTVMLYECKDQTCLSPDISRLNLVDKTGNNKAVSYERILPDGNTENQSGEYFITIAPNKLYDTAGNLYNNGKLKSNMWYRVFLGKDITAWNGKTLEKLNFALGGGEDCDDKNNANNDGCSSQCLSEGNSSLCGNNTLDIGEDCDDGNKTNEDGCSSLCINEGSNYDFRCGDGEEQGADQGDAVSVSYAYYGTTYSVWLDPGEECDPISEPWKSKGGCSNVCTLLGSSKDAQSEPICGDGKLSWSEQCDPSVAPWTTGGCGDNCLLDGASHRGTTNSLCGNSIKEIGEDCDDGNTLKGDGCNDMCLHEGSLGSAVCGDGVVNTSASDGFSWIFKTGLTDDVCVVDRIEVLPKEYNASYIGETYNTFTQPYSSSDECNTKGEKLNPEDSRYQWDWDPRDNGSLRNSFSTDPTKDVNPQVGILNVDLSLMSFEEEMNVLGEGDLDTEGAQDTVVASQIKEGTRTPLLCQDNGGTCGELSLQCGFTKDSECLAGCDLLAGTCIDNSSVSCTANADCVGVGTSTCCELRPLVESCSPTADTTFATCVSGATNQCRNILIEVSFDERLDPNNITGNVAVEKISGECVLAKNHSFFQKVFVFLKQFIGFGREMRAAGCFVSGTTSEGINEKGNSTITFTPTDYLDSTSKYRVTVYGDDNFSDSTKTGIRNFHGVSMKGDYSWDFVTGDDICTLDYVEVTVARRDESGIVGKITNSDLFQCAGDDCPEDYTYDISATQHYYYAQARDNSGVAIAHVNYDWKFNSNPDELLKFDETSEQATFITLHKAVQDERTKIGVSAEGEDPAVGSASQEIEAHVFLCNNPWPRYEDFPFRDSENNCTISGAQSGTATSCGDFNFETYYCRDAGDEKSTADDLPALRAVSATTASLDPLNFTCNSSVYISSTVPHSCVVVASSEGENLDNLEKDRKLKELFFTYEDASIPDAIGLRVYENKNEYSPERWYKNSAPNQGKPTSSTLDDYQAIVDGRSIYVAGTNLSTDSLYTNTYLLSYNEGAQSATQDIYSQLGENLTLNTNVDDSGVCVLPSLSSGGIQEKWRWAPEDGEYTDVMSTPAIADLDPTDDNNTPQVIVNAFDYDKPCTWNCGGRVRVLDGASGKEVSSFNKYDITDARLQTYGRSQMAVGNIDADQELEMVIGGSSYCATSNGSIPTQVCGDSAPVCAAGTQCVSGGVFALNHDGSVLWWTPYQSGIDEVLSIFDFDQDGLPEVKSGSVILDGATGEKIGNIPTGYTTYPTVADIDNDGKNELIAGGVVFEVNGRGAASFFTEKYKVSGWEYSNVGVADFNGDEYPDLLLVKNSTTEIGVFELKTGAPQQLWSDTYDIGICENKSDSICATDNDCSRSQCNAQLNGAPGAPVIADFDGDGGPDIGVKGKNAYVAINGDNGDLLWDYRRDRDDGEYTDGSASSSSAFDFNNDGAYEITQRNLYNFYIFDGKGKNGKGVVLFKNNNHSNTLYELAPIVDVDNDGHADIVVPSNDNGTGTYKNTGIIVFESATDSWPATRTIWNQDNYFIDNICDGTEGIGGCKYGDIPSVALRPWERTNSLRSNAQVASEAFQELIQCSEDHQCGGTGICMADKQKLIRDTKRLADVRDMQVLADTYKNQYGSYPLLESGTYVKGASLSVWPSWDQTLPAYFGDLPVDPLNKLYGCSNPYDPTTCWDPVALAFSCPTEGYSYAYQTQADGKTGKFYAGFEYANAFTKGSFVNSTAECADGADNDGDKKADYPADPGCKGSWDDTEDDVALDFGALCLSNFGTIVGDYDADQVADDVDNCDSTPNATQEDADDDGIGNQCDTCPFDTDPDHDNICTYDLDRSALDNCQNTYNPDQTDHDADGVGDACDIGSCTGDADGDSVCDETDNCPILFNPNQGDDCSQCPAGEHDNDKDGICSILDNCPDVYNPSQVDTDDDGIGDACDTCHDTDKDGYGNKEYNTASCLGVDNCQDIVNPDQADLDKDNIGDACDAQTCGNEDVESGEECDINPGDGKSSTSQYSCSEDCKWTGGWCGDGIIQTGEACESAGTGSSATDQYVCSSCKWSGGYCGDKSIQTPNGEQCDQGPDGGPIITTIEGTTIEIVGGTNYDNPYLCKGLESGKVIQGESCTVDHDSGWCGDGIVQSDFEQCDGITTTNKKLHMVFVLDTSGSMRDEASSLCDAITGTVADLEKPLEDGGGGFKVKTSVYAMLVVPDTNDQDGKCYNSTDSYSDCKSLEIYQGIIKNCSAEVKVITLDPGYATQFTILEAYPGKTVSTNAPEDAGPSVYDIAKLEDWTTGYIPIIIPITDDYPQNGWDGYQYRGTSAYDVYQTADEQSVVDAIAAANAVDNGREQPGAYVFPVYGDQRGELGHALYQTLADSTDGALIEYHFDESVDTVQMSCFIQGIINQLYCDGDGTSDGIMDCTLPSNSSCN